MLTSYSGFVESYKKRINSPVTQHDTPNRSEFSTSALWKQKCCILSASAERLVHGEESVQALNFYYDVVIPVASEIRKLHGINVSRHDITHTGY